MKLNKLKYLFFFLNKSNITDILTDLYTTQMVKMCIYQYKIDFNVATSNLITSHHCFKNETRSHGLEYEFEMMTVRDNDIYLIFCSM